MGNHHQESGILKPFERRVSKKKGDRAPGWLSLLNVRLLVSALVMISQFHGFEPASGSALVLQRLLGILSPSLSAPPSLALSQNKYINFKKRKRNKRGDGQG